ncbi:Pr6Pr family membrane protein [Microbacterium sp. bgisy207]|uniref:Pr6Pr family membrane protein n=1 Tax=Microbacterium sp. bgisy207 TaxID=3413800 RepID=UPI003EBF1E41
MLRSRRWAQAWAVLRLLVAAAGVAAIVGQLIRTVSISAANGWPLGLTAVDFFSFFTILSNVGAAVALTIGAFLILRGHRIDPAWFATLLAAVSTYMLITGIVYNALLRGLPLPQGSTVPWSNEILHVWAPLFLLLDVFLGPLRRRLPWRALWAVIAFPLVWVTYTLIRGPLVTDFRTGNPWWYPYPFLNPNVQPWGYAGVALYVVGIAAGILLIAAGVIWLGRRRGAEPGDPPVAQ